MATKLGLYQEALELLGERNIADLTEDREPRRVLDNAYDRTVLFCLEQGFWNWALRSVELQPEPGIEPAFGFTYAFSKPSDWLRTFTLAADERLDTPADDVLDENGYWLADIDTLYARYVSSSTDFGRDLSLWPPSFSAYVALALARRACRRITNSSDLYGDLFKLETKAKADALSKDAINEGPARLPMGSWAASRSRGTQTSRWNRTFR